MMVIIRGVNNKVGAGLNWEARQLLYLSGC